MFKVFEPIRLAPVHGLKVLQPNPPLKQSLQSAQCSMRRNYFQTFLSVPHLYRSLDVDTNFKHFQDSSKKRGDVSVRRFCFVHFQIKNEQIYHGPPLCFANLLTKKTSNYPSCSSQAVGFPLLWSLVEKRKQKFHLCRHSPLHIESQNTIHSCFYLFGNRILASVAFAQIFPGTKLPTN